MGCNGAAYLRKHCGFSHLRYKRIDKAKGKYERIFNYLALKLINWIVVTQLTYFFYFNESPGSSGLDGLA